MIATIPIGWPSRYHRHPMSEGTPLTGIDARTHAPVRVAATGPPSNSHLRTHFGGWRGALRDAVVAELADFVSRRCGEALGESGVDIATDVLMDFLHGGKCLRSTFTYLAGGAEPTITSRRCEPQPVSNCCMPSPCFRTT